MTEQVTVAKPRVLSTVHTPCGTEVTVPVISGWTGLADAMREHCQTCHAALEARTEGGT